MTERFAIRIKIAAFVLIVSAPLLALLVLGAVPPYGQRLHPAFPKARALLHGKHGTFDQLGRAILNRSAVMKEAIRLKYMFDYNVSRYVDTELVVSGREDWLFYKDDFSKTFVCVDEARMVRALAQVDAMTDIAAAAGLRLFVSISPDKSTVYPEYLHPLARRYWGCKGESAAMLRRLIATEAPRIIDHAAPLLAEKARGNATDLFWHQDTHWTPRGAAFARRQLFDAVVGHREVDVPAPRMTGEKVQRDTDLGNLMLLLPHKEIYEQIDMGVENEMVRAYAATPVRQAVMLVDSFYGVAPFNEPAVFPGLEEFHVDKNDAALTALLADARTLVINSVERSLLARIEQGALSWRSRVGLAVIARNMAAAQACGEFETVTPRARDGWEVVKVPVSGEGRLTCVRITIDTPGADVEIAWQHGDGIGFEDGRAVQQTIGPGKQVLSMILPDTGARGFGIRATAQDKTFAAQTIEVGTIDVPDNFINNQ